MRILFFGPLSDFSGTRELTPPHNVNTLQNLQEWLTRDNPRLREALLQKGTQIAVNGKIIPNNCTLQKQDEIAFMSPMSGG